LSNKSKYGSISGAILSFVFLVLAHAGLLDSIIENWPSVPFPAQLMIFGSFSAWAALAWAEDFFRAWKRDWPDFDKWDAEDSFRLWEAAALWVDETPRRPPGRRERKQFRAFSKAISQKKLEVLRESLNETILDAIDETDGKKVKSNPEWIVRREDLIKFAETQNEKPRFLFQKERM
jgi:hypothetical protein